MSKTEKPIIKLDTISKKYNEYGVIVNALDKISLKIFPGEFVSIIGPSGCGKSTLLHCMGLLDRPSSGTVYIDEKDTSKISGKEIAIRFGLKQEDTHVEPRKYIWEAITKYKLPVAGGGKGYYWITSQAELDAYSKTMDSRAEKIIKRKEAIKKYFKEYKEI